MTILSKLTFFSMIKILFIWSSVTCIKLLFFNHYYQINYSHHCLLGQVGCLSESNYLSNLFKVFITRMEEQSNCHLIIILQRVQIKNKNYIIPYYLLFYDRRLEALDQLHHLHKGYNSLFFISKWFHNKKIVKELFKYRVYNTLVYLGADLPQTPITNKDLTLQ